MIIGWRASHPYPTEHAPNRVERSPHLQYHVEEHLIPGPLSVSHCPNPSVQGREDYEAVWCTKCLVYQ
mgnify:CR=1 FL=1